MENIVCASIEPGELVPSPRELESRLGVPDPTQDKTIAECMERVISVCKPRYCYAKTSVLLNEENKSCILDFVTADSLSLCRALRGCNGAYVAAVTLGMDVDRLISRLSVTSKAEHFMADAIASALAESAMDHVNALFVQEQTVQRYSAGFGDFVLSYQEPILSYLRADKLLGIKLGKRYIMTPRKSVTAIIGVKTNGIT